MRRFLQDEIVRDIVGGATAHQELEAEFNQLEQDRDTLRAIFPSGNSKVGDMLYLWYFVGLINYGCKLFHAPTQHFESG